MATQPCGQNTCSSSAEPTCSHRQHPTESIGQGLQRPKLRLQRNHHQQENSMNFQSIGFFKKVQMLLQVTFFLLIGRGWTTVHCYFKKKKKRGKFITPFFPLPEIWIGHPFLQEMLDLFNQHQLLNTESRLRTALGSLHLWHTRSHSTVTSTRSSLYQTTGPIVSLLIDITFTDRR